MPISYQRTVVSLSVGALASLAYTIRYKAGYWFSHGHADFGPAWFGARAILHGQNPYDLIGPGLTYDWPWPALYPASAFVAAIPLSFLPEYYATFLFVFLSFVLLTLAITKDGWWRLPMFLSIPALTSATAAQWTPLVTASIGIPALGFFLAAKPTEAISAFVCKKDLRWYAVIGGLFLLIVSLVLLPGWPAQWYGQTRNATHIESPIFRYGGFLMLLALLKWRRPEASFLLAMSLVPSTGTWYPMLPLFWIPKNRNEVMILSMSSSVGWLLQDHVVTATNEAALNHQVGGLVVLFGFLPCLVMILRRRNEREIH